MKKVIALLCTFLLIFSCSFTTIIASSENAAVVLTEETTDPSTPDEPTDPEPSVPDESTDPEPSVPDESTDPEPSPVQPDPSTPSQPAQQPSDPVYPSDSDYSNDWNNDTDYDDYYNDDTDNTLDTAEPTPTPTPTPTPSNLPAGAEYIDGTYPMVLTTDAETLTVSLTEKAYSIAEDTQAGSTTVITLNKDALNTAIDTGSAKLSEKQKENSKLTKLEITIDPIDASKLITSNTTVSIPLGSVKKLPKNTATLVIPAGNTSYALTAGFIDSNTLSSYGDDDCLRLLNTSTVALNSKEYTISDIVYTALASPFALSAELQKTNGERQTLSAFAAPLTLTLTLDDTQKKALTGSASLCSYKSSSDTVTPLVSNYDKKANTLTSELNGPQTLVLMSKADGSQLSPLVIIIPVVLILLLILCYFIIKRRQQHGLLPKQHKVKKAKRPKKINAQHSATDEVPSLFKEEPEIDLSQFDLHDRFEDDEDEHDQ